MPEDKAKVVEAILSENGSLESIVVEQEDHSRHTVAVGGTSDPSAFPRVQVTFNVASLGTGQIEPVLTISDGAVGTWLLSTDNKKVLAPEDGIYAVVGNAYTDEYANGGLDILVIGDFSGEFIWSQSRLFVHPTAELSGMSSAMPSVPLVWFFEEGMEFAVDLMYLPAPGGPSTSNVHGDVRIQRIA